MKYGVYLPNFGLFGDPQRVVQWAQDAETAGWDGFFIWDHINRSRTYDVIDPWIVLAAIAVQTEHIRFGAMVTPLARRRPQKVAREAATLDQLSGGRLILGVGLGGASGIDVEWHNFGEVTDLRTRAAMTDEALTIINGLWSGKPFSFVGEHYSVGESLFLPRPVQQPRIPIWIAGYYPSRAPLRRAARWDGLFMLYGDADDRIAALHEATQYVMERRDQTQRFDVVFLDPAPMSPIANRQAIARDAEAAGATWWLESIAPYRYGEQYDWDTDWPAEAMHATILEGPPTIESTSNE